MFTADDVFKQISVLSGGEKARLTFAKLMLEKSDMFILDEPTNHLDSPSREVLEQALGEYGGTILAVSHDRYFIKKLANRILEMRSDGCMCFEGSYESFVEYKNKVSAKADVSDVSKDKGGAGSTSSGKEDYLKAKEQKSKARRLEKQIADTEKRISELENELSENQRRQEECASDYVKVNELFGRAHEIEEELEKMYQLLDTLI